MLIFLKMMCSQSDEAGILHVLEIKIFTSQAWWAAFKKFLKIPSVDVTLWWWYHCNLRTEK